MKVIQEYFLCDACQNRDFMRIYNFSLRFHGINFSDELIYDRVTDEVYKCAKCQKVFTLEQVEKEMTALKEKYKKKDS